MEAGFGVLAVSDRLLVLAELVFCEAALRVEVEAIAGEGTTIEALGLIVVFGFSLGLNLESDAEIVAAVVSVVAVDDEVCVVVLALVTEAREVSLGVMPPLTVLGT